MIRVPPLTGRRSLGDVGRAARGLRIVLWQLDGAALAPRARDLLRRSAEVGDHVAAAAAGRTGERFAGLGVVGGGHATGHASRSVARGRAAPVAGSCNSSARIRSKLLREGGFERWTCMHGVGTMDLMPGGKDANGKDVALVMRA